MDRAERRRDGRIDVEPKVRRPSPSVEVDVSELVPKRHFQSPCPGSWDRDAGDRTDIATAAAAGDAPLYGATGIRRWTDPVVHTRIRCATVRLGLGPVDVEPVLRAPTMPAVQSQTGHRRRGAVVDQQTIFACDVLTREEVADPHGPVRRFEYEIPDAVWQLSGPEGGRSRDLRGTRLFRRAETGTPNCGSTLKAPSQPQDLVLVARRRRRDGNSPPLSQPVGGSGETVITGGAAIAGGAAQAVAAIKTSPTQRAARMDFLDMACTSPPL